MKLIDEAGQWYRFLSVKLAVVAGMVSAYFTAYPDKLAEMVNVLPEHWRPVASVAIGLFVFSAATGARLVKQGGRE